MVIDFCCFVVSAKVVLAFCSFGAKIKDTAVELQPLFFFFFVLLETNSQRSKKLVPLCVRGECTMAAVAIMCALSAGRRQAAGAVGARDWSGVDGVGGMSAKASKTRRNARKLGALMRHFANWHCTVVEFI